MHDLTFSSLMTSLLVYAVATAIMWLAATVISTHNHDVDGAPLLLLIAPISLAANTCGLLPFMTAAVMRILWAIWMIAFVSLSSYHMLQRRAKRAALASHGNKALGKPSFPLRDEPRLGPGYELADPFILRHEGEYFLYATTDGSSLNVYRSRRLDVWDPRQKTTIWTTNKFWWLASAFGSYGNSGVWAPEVIVLDGKVLVYFTQGHTVYVLRGESPLGPFEPAREIRLPGQGFTGIAIDPSPFVDPTDGALYLFYATFMLHRYWLGPQEVRMVRMSDYATPDGASTPVVRPDRSWEMVNSVALAPRGVNEGPFVVRHGERYVLFYSGSGADTAFYNIGVAVASRPEGPYTKLCAEAGLVNITDLPGVGHCSLLRETNDRGTSSYHLVAHRKASASAGWNRSPVIFPLDLDELLRSFHLPL
jgi:hypothetical protein